MFNRDLYVELLRKINNEETVALVTIIETINSAPGKFGFKMLVDASGETLGTVGGGFVEAKVIEDANKCIREKKSRICSYNLDNDISEKIGMICGGKISVFIDIIGPPETLLLVGAGHVAQPLSTMGAVLGFKVVVLDDREDFCNIERFPNAERCLVGNIEEILSTFEITDNTYVVIITRGHALDHLALELTLNSKAAYLGMIGSRKKVEASLSKLRKTGYDENKISRVYAPIGIDIGAKTAEEIAVSILAEIITHKQGKKNYN